MTSFFSVVFFSEFNSEVDHSIFWRRKEEVDVVSMIGEVRAGVRVVVLGPFSFAWNSMLKSVFVPSSVEIFCNDCFHDCKNLSSVIFEIGCKVSVIEDGAIGHFYSLRSICIPSSIDILCDSCFIECENLSCVILEIGCKVSAIQERVFGYCVLLISICIPATVKTLGTSCLSDCKTLSSFILLPRSTQSGKWFSKNANLLWFQK
jgi:hypothetical protein